MNFQAQLFCGVKRVFSIESQYDLMPVGETTNVDDSYTIHRSSFKTDRRLKHKATTTKLLEENVTSSQPWIHVDFLGSGGVKRGYKIAGNTRKKVKLYIMRIKLPFTKRHEKERKWKVKHTLGENIWQYTCLTNALCPDYSSNSHRSIIIKKGWLCFKWENIRQRYNGRFLNDQ